MRFGFFPTNPGLHILKNPAGTFHFVGSVPQELAYVCSNPDYFRIAAQCGPGFAMQAAKRDGGTFKTLTFETEAAARDAARAAGFTVAN